MNPILEPIRPRGLRTLGLVAAGLLVVTAFADHNRTFGHPLPLAERGALVALLLGFAATVVTVPVVTRHAGTISRLLFGAVGVWVASRGVRYGYSVSDALNVLVTAFAIGVIYPNVRTLLIFYTAMLATVAAGFTFGPPSEMEGVQYYGLLLTGFLGTTMVARSRAAALAEAGDLLLLEARVKNPVLVLDRDGCLLRGNEVITALLGAPIVPGAPMVTLLDTQTTLPDDVARLSRALAEGGSGAFELALRRRDGPPARVTADLTPTRWQNAITGYLVVFSDATRAHALVTQILDAMSDALFIVNSSGDIDSVNPAACRMLGGTPADLVGQPLEPMVLPDWRWSDTLTAEAASSPGTGANLVLLLLGGELDAPLVDVDLAFRSRTGEVIPVLVAASILPGTGDGSRHLLIIARDARERRRLEEQRDQLIRQAQEAQKLESLGVLAGGIAHDFNNLLVGILGNSSLLLDRLPAESPVRGPVANIEIAAQRAADLTRQMLAYAGKGSFLIEPVSVGQLVVEMADLLDASLSKRAQLNVRAAPDLPAVEGDATQLRQVVMNLLTNASDALEGRSGTIDVRVYAEDVEDDGGVRMGADLRGSRCVCLEVYDSGMGMTEEVRRRMFDPFFTTKVQGRGLGLAAILGIVQAHRGALHVESAPGVGTRIRVWFPALAAPAPVRPPVSSIPPGRTSGLVLVVDDEAIVRGFISTVLEDAGYTVLAVGDGAEAVDVVRAHGDALVAVVLDLTMPNMGGDEAMREMRLIRPDLPVLLSSGYSQEDARERFGALGAGGFLQKPYRAAALLDAVTTVRRVG